MIHVSSSQFLWVGSVYLHAIPPLFSLLPLDPSPPEPLLQDPLLDPITTGMTLGQSPEQTVRTGGRAGLLTCDQDVQGGTGGRPRIREVVSTVAPIPAPMGEAHRAQGEFGALLTIETLGWCGPLVLGQSESVKARL